MTPRTFLLSALLTVLSILAVCRWGGVALAVLFFGGILAGLGKAWLDLRHEAKEYNEEHDLP